MAEFVNGVGMAELLGIAPALCWYRREAIGVEADAYVVGHGGKRTALYSLATVRDFATRWEKYMSTSRQYRADLARWRNSKPVSPDRELVDA
jgi:allophanate hydrolase subunit 1